VNGVLLVDKDPGLTSHDVVAKTRKLLGTKSVGHAGTLDPLASGLLILLVGEATKVSDYLLNGDKGYEVTVRLGVRTDSMDITGLVLEEKSTAGLTEDRIRDIAESVSGVVELKVPMHSAVKVNGKKLYESAHKGEIPPEIPIRAMSFYDIEWKGLNKLNLPDKSPEISAVSSPDAAPRGLEFTVALRCSKGSFIRAWANHVGQLLGVGGTVTALRRVMSAPFDIHQAKTLSVMARELETARLQSHDVGPTALGPAWVPLADSLPHFERIEITGHDATLLKNGQLSKSLQSELLRRVQLGEALKPMRVIHREERRLLALLAAEPGEFYKIRRVFV